MMTGTFDCASFSQSGYSRRISVLAPIIRPQEVAGESATFLPEDWRSSWKSVDPAWIVSPPCTQASITLTPLMRVPFFDPAVKSP